MGDFGYGVEESGWELGRGVCGIACGWLSVLVNTPF